MKRYFVKFLCTQVSLLFSVCGLMIVFPFSTFAQSSNIGIIKGIWFSKSPVFAGETIRVYTGLQNNSGFDVTGTVDFFNNDEHIGSQDFSTLDGRIIESWIDFRPNFGDHTFSVKINSVQANEIGGKKVIISPHETQSNELIFIDYDTDGDGIGNQSDPDDDGDGYSDSEELKHNTDPLDLEEHPTKDEGSSLLSNVFGEGSNINDDTKDTKDNVGIPKSIQNTVGDSGILASVALGISEFQKGATKLIESEQERILIKKNIKLSKLPTEFSETRGETGNGATEGQSFGNILYSYFLDILHFIASSWWFITFIVIIVTYRLLRFFIRIAKRRN